MGRTAPFFLLDLAFFICVLEVVIPPRDSKVCSPSLPIVSGWGHWMGKIMNNGTTKGRRRRERKDFLRRSKLAASPLHCNCSRT